MIPLAEIEAAARHVYAAMLPTPQYAWPLLGRRAGRAVWVKHENHTPTGAFKVRGGLNLLATLAAAGSAAGIISATRGNHGQSLAYAARRYGTRCVIVVPHGNSADKNAAMRAFGAELIEFGRDFDEARLHAAELARDAGPALRRAVRARARRRRRHLRARAVARGAATSPPSTCPSAAARASAA